MFRAEQVAEHLQVSVFFCYCDVWAMVMMVNDLKCVASFVEIS